MPHQRAGSWALTRDTDHDIKYCLRRHGAGLTGMSLAGLIAKSTGGPAMCCDRMAATMTRSINLQIAVSRGVCGNRTVGFWTSHVHLREAASHQDSGTGWTGSRRSVSRARSRR